MKRTLIIVRHAKADRDGPWPDDFSRPLTPRGVSDALLMAHELKLRGLVPDMVLSSPATRAVSTATIISALMGLDLSRTVLDRSIYLATLPELMAAVGNVPDTVKSIMLFGHNPGLTDLVNELVPGTALYLPTCGMACIDIDIKSWKDLSHTMGEIRQSLFAKDLR